jgi:ABC-type transporter Mla subunit MlaD
MIKSKKQLFLSIGLYFLCVSCGASKYSQCQELFTLVNQGNKEVKTLTNGVKGEDLSKFTQAAEALKVASDDIASLQLKDQELIKYQESFAQIYQSYAESTFQMIKAKENNNRNLANAALKKVSEMTQLEKETGANLQSYCSTQ